MRKMMRDRVCDMRTGSALAPFDTKLLVLNVVLLRRKRCKCKHERERKRLLGGDYSNSNMPLLSLTQPRFSPRTILPSGLLPRQ